MPNNLFQNLSTRELLTFKRRISDPILTLKDSETESIGVKIWMRGILGQGKILNMVWEPTRHEKGEPHTNEFSGDFFLELYVKKTQ